MHKSTFFGIVSAAAILIAGSSASGQEEKLKYVRCETDSALAPLFFELKGDELKKATTQKGLTSRNALVGTIKTAGKTIMIAVDASGKEFDMIRLDPTGKGQFDPKACMKMKVKKDDGGFYGSFGESETIELTIDNRNIKLSITGNCSCLSFMGAPTYTIQISFYCAAEGKCTFGDKTYPVRLIDGAGRLDVGTAVKVKVDPNRLGTPIDGDTVIVDTGDGSFSKSVFMGLYGMPLRVDEKWYDIKLSADKTAITAQEIDVQAGSVKFPHEKWSCILLGRKFLMRLSGGLEPVQLPADTYQLVSFSEFGRAEEGGPEPFANFDMSAVAATGKGKAIEVKSGTTTDVAVGTPLTAEVTLDKSVKGAMKFVATMKDSMGNVPKQIIGRSGKPIQSPFLIINDPKGQQVDKQMMQDTGNGVFSFAWEPPDKARGKVVVKLEFNADPFKVDSKELQVDIRK